MNISFSTFSKFFIYFFEDLDEAKECQNCKQIVSSSNQVTCPNCGLITDKLKAFKGFLIIALFTVSIFVFNYFHKSNFERFAYEMCNLEGKYTKRICSCNANNLDDILSNNEKEAFREIVAGGMPSFDLITSISDKSEKVIKNCVS